MSSLMYNISKNLIIADKLDCFSNEKQGLSRRFVHPNQPHNTFQDTRQANSHEVNCRYYLQVEDALQQLYNNTEGVMTLVSIYVNSM